MRIRELRTGEEKKGQARLEERMSVRGTDHTLGHPEARHRQNPTMAGIFFSRCFFPSRRGGFVFPTSKSWASIVATQSIM